MRILIDCTQITRVKAGVGVYAINLLERLIPLDPTVEYFLLVQSDDTSFDFPDFSNVVVLRVESRFFRKLPLRFLLEQCWIPFLTLYWKINVVHSLHYSFPLVPLRAKKVVTLHDMTMILMPEVHLATKVKYFGFFIRAAARKADFLLFISHSGRDDFHKLFPGAKGSLHVACMGKSSVFQPGVGRERLGAILDKYGLRQPYLLYVGMLEPRKNLGRLIQAFAVVAEKYSQYTLVLAGSRGWMCDDLPALVEQYGLQRRVVFPGFVAEMDKAPLIAGADIFTYPSLYEGFGIPLLESMACGVPAVSGNTSSLAEVAGDAALLIDPYSISEITDALNALLGDPSLRASLAARAVAQAAQFDWSITAVETLRVYRTAAGTGKSK